LVDFEDGHAFHGRSLKGIDPPVSMRTRREMRSNIAT